ncbi:hypothetical protein OROHE_026586 [Orobanche hederae]
MKVKGKEEEGESSKRKRKVKEKEEEESSKRKRKGKEEEEELNVEPEKKSKKKGKEEEEELNVEPEKKRKKKKSSPLKKKKKVDGKQESMPPIGSTTGKSESEKENLEAPLSARAKKRQRDRSRKAAKKLAAEKKAAKIFQELESTGRYPMSWLFLSKPMLHNLVLAIYWGPTWANALLKWFIHGGWPEKSSINEQSEVPFDRACDVRLFHKVLQKDIRKHWPAVKKNFHRDEWRKHGRGTGMLVEEYFATIMDIYQAVMKIGVNLQAGVVMSAKEAKSLMEKELGQIYMSAFKGQRDLGVAGEDGDTTLFINELEIIIDKGIDKYGIIAKPHKHLYAGHIKTGKEMVTLATEPVKLEKDEDATS